MASRETVKERKREETEQQGMDVVGHQTSLFKNITKSKICERDGRFCCWVIWDSRGTWEVEEYIISIDSRQKPYNKII